MAVRAIEMVSRTVSEVTYRLSEFQDNVPHLSHGAFRVTGTILDGELVCPASSLNTGSTIAATSLQATMAIVAASPDKAQRIQESQNAHLRYHVFDILRYRGQEVTSLPLLDRQDLVEKAVREINNLFVEVVPSFVVNKAEIHRRIIDAGGEGTVWKKVDGPYESGRRVKHWIKRKRGIEMEAFVTGFKPGTNGHAALVGAIEFSVSQASGSPKSVAWVSSWPDDERRSFSIKDGEGNVTLDNRLLGRRAVIEGQRGSTSQS